MRPGPVTVRISEEDKKYLTDEAEKHGMSLAEILRAGAQIIAGFDEDFWKRLNNFSRNMNMTASFVIQNILTSWMAQKAAEDEVFPQSPELLIEFAYSSSGPLSSSTLFENLKATHIDRLEKQKELSIRIRVEKGIASQREINWLKKRDELQDQRDQEQNEAEEAVSEGRKGTLPADELENILDDMKKHSSE